MRTLYYPDDFPEERTGLDTAAHGYAATIGFFDGVHRGHRHVIECLRQQSLPTMVITFERHPRQVVQPQWQPLLLTTLQEKQALLARTGIDVLVVLRFDAAMARLTAGEFMLHVLKQQLYVSLLLTGYDNRFGHNRTEGFADYVRYGQQMGIRVVAAAACEENGLRFSSSLIRRQISEGHIAEANACLGRCYTLNGTVAHGHQIGRTMGFPTANLVPDNPCKLLPPFGVYAVRVSLPPLNSQLSTRISQQESLSTYKAIMNIGMRPTFHGHVPTLEVHVFDFDGDLYGRQLTVGFVARLRGEQAFDTKEALACQMRKDAVQARQILENP